MSLIIADIFVNPQFSHVEAWPYTFPSLEPTTQYQPVTLSPRLYNLNAIETVASAMEGSVLAARNIAQLIMKAALDV